MRLPRPRNALGRVRIVRVGAFAHFGRRVLQKLGLGRYVEEGRRKAVGCRPGDVPVAGVGDGALLCLREREPGGYDGGAKVDRVAEEV